MRNYLGYIIIGAALGLGGLWAIADVTLTEFEAGTTIKSAEVNANFQALNDELATKQLRVTGECEVGSAIRLINDDGTVECELTGTTSEEGYTKAEVDAKLTELTDLLYTKTEVDAKLAALTGENIVDDSLRLADLGGDRGVMTQTVGSNIVLGAGECKAQLTGNFGAGVIGSLVVGTLSDADGDPVLPNTAVVMPSIVIGTTQGGAVPNLVACNTGSGTLTIPAGSVFTWRMISP